jgi:CRISPR/Cas system CSM-associated protein Csm3 (group 7 of RAMP superfamily)
MKRFTIAVRPDLSALAVGGQTAPSPGADKATARDAAGRVVIPASALRGALRIELERLLRGRDGDGAVCSANRAAPAEPWSPCGCPVCHLFGEEAGATGTLRLEDAVWQGDDTLARAGAVRPQVAVSRATGTAADRHLAFLETGPLVLEKKDGRGPLLRAEAFLVPFPGDGADRLAADERNLRAACAALIALGGGKARGLGWVECALEGAAGEEGAAAGGAGEREPREASPGHASSEDIASLALRFTARAPLHFGEGRPIGYFQPTLSHAPGSAVRGAVAFALLERGLEPGDPRFLRLVAPGGPGFGSARAEGELPRSTRRRCRAAGHVFDDLVGELVRREAARRGLALAAERACAVPGCEARKLLAAPRRAGAAEPVLRVRTRTALNRRTGTSMDAKLYSMEVVEPVVGEGDARSDLVLQALVHGLDAELASLVEALDGADLWLGGKRSKGLGRCRVSVAREASDATGAAEARVEALAAALDAAWQVLGAAAAGRDLAPIVPDGEVPLAIALDEPWCPAVAPDAAAEALARGPLGLAEVEGLRLLDAFVTLAEEGRFGANEARRYGAAGELTGERPPLLAAAPGSTYVYAVSRARLHEHLPAWVELGHRGSGLEREAGWGRFVVRGPEDE